MESFLIKSKASGFIDTVKRRVVDLKDIINKTIKPKSQEAFTASVTDEYSSTVNEIFLNEYNMPSEISESLVLKKMNARIQTFVQQSAPLEKTMTSCILSNLLEDYQTLTHSANPLNKNTGEQAIDSVVSPVSNVGIDQQPRASLSSARGVFGSNNTLFNPPVMESLVKNFTTDESAANETIHNPSLIEYHRKSDASDESVGNETILNPPTIDSHRNSDATEITRANNNDNEASRKPGNFGLVHRAVITALAAQALEPQPYNPFCVFDGKGPTLDIKYEEETKSKKKAAVVNVYEYKKFLNLYTREEFADIMYSFMFRWEESEGIKSNTTMFFSWDRKYVAKIVSSQEASQGRKFIKKLAEHHSKHKQSMIIKYAALIKISISNEKPVQFLIMPNPMHGFKLAKAFNLKGSLHERTEETLKVMTDQKFKSLEQQILFSDKYERYSWLNKLERDVDFLKKNGRIDYSLLIGFEHEGKWKCCIVDIITPITVFKRIEYNVKRITHDQDQQYCVPPHKYADRFYNFLSDACLLIK